MQPGARRWCQAWDRDELQNRGTGFGYSGTHLSMSLKKEATTKFTLKHNIFLFILGEFLTVDSDYTLFHSPPVHPRSTLYLPTLCPLSLFKKHNNLCCPFTHGYGAIHSSAVDLPGARMLKQTDSPYPKKPLTISTSSVRVGVPPPCWLAWSGAGLMQTTTTAVSSWV